MSGNAYRIGVEIALSGNAMQFLAQLGQAMTGAHLKAKELEGSLNRAKMALAGMASVAAGVGLFKIMAHTAEKAGELSHALVQIQKLGVTPQQYAQVQAGAQSAARQVKGVTQVDALHAYGAAYSIFGHDDALKMMAPITRFEQVLGNTTGDYKGASEKVYSMVRAGELMGQFVDHNTHKVDVEKLSGFLSFASKAALATHGKVGPDQWLGMAQQGGPALSGMSQEGMLTMVAVAQAMGGPRAGTALMSAAQQFLGGTTTQRTAKAAQKYGLVGDYDVGRGGQVQFRDGSLNTPFIKALREDPLEAMKIAQKALYDAGKKNVEEQVPELYKIFGRQTTQRMMHDLLRNMPQIEAERKRLKGAMGTGDADATANEQDISKNIHNLSAAWKDFQATLGNSPMVVSALQSITGAIKGMTDWAQANPGTMDVMRQAMIGLAAGLTALGVALGGAALVAFAGTGGLIVAGIAGVAAALAALAAVNWEGVSGAVKGMDSWLESWRGMGTKMAQDLYASLPSGNDVGRAFIAVGKGISDAINSLAKTIGSAFDAVVSAIARGAAAIAALAAVNWEGVSGAVKGMDSWLESWRGMGTKMAQDLYASLPSGNDIARAFIAVGKGISDAINSLAKTIGSAFDAVVSAIARGAAAIKNIFGGSPGPSAPGASAGAVLGSALAGKRAMGGPVNWGAPYLVGENGPEVFVPRGSGDIIPNHRLAGVGAPPRGGQAQESHHHIYIDGEQVHRVVERRMIASATHPSGPSLFNGESMWAPPDMQYAAA